MNKVLDQNLIRYLIGTCLFRGLFTQSIIIIYFLSLGYSNAKISLLFAIYGIAVIASQIPSGYLADKYSRHIIFSFWGIFVFLGTLLPIINTSFISLCFAEGLCGLAVGFGSGKETAYLHDYLSVKGHKNAYSTIYSKQLVLENYMYAIASFVGGYLASIDIFIPFYITIGSMVIGTLFVISLSACKPKYRIAKVSLAFKCCYFNSLQNKRLFSYMALSFLICGGLSFCYWQFQPFVEMANVSTKYLGFIYLLIHVAMAFYSKLIPSLLRRFTIKRILLFHVGIFYFQLFLLSNLSNLPSIFVITLIFAASYNFRSFLNIAINETVTSTQRAMYLSVAGTLEYVGYIVYFLMNSIIVEQLTFQHSLLVICVISLFLLILGYFYIRKRKVTINIIDPIAAQDAT
ncbi:MAG: MFS transporter [Parcubacteria group bacterium]